MSSGERAGQRCLGKWELAVGGQEWGKLSGHTVFSVFVSLS